MINVDTIYIVDDDTITAFGIKKLIHKSISCQTVLEFKNGKEAMNHIQESLSNGGPIPDLIFLDINMPIMDGWQFLEEFLKIPFNKKIVINIITSSIDQTDVNTWESYKSRMPRRLYYNIKPIFSIDFKELLSADIAS